MHVSSPSNIIYKATVIGAGPSGLACIGNLLDLLPSTDKILWIDLEFQAGRLSSYPAVPSNTKVCLFTKFAESCKSFEPEKNSKTFRKLKREFNGQKGCKLGLVADLCRELTEKMIVNKETRMKVLKDTVCELDHCKESQVWTVKTEKGKVFQSNLIFLTTGSKPKSLNLEGDTIFLDDALNPEILKLKIDSTDRIAVYGSSHSAMLVLMNLLSIIKDEQGPELIVNYYRQASKFASFPDPINQPDLILHDNTGLKGEVAEWVKTWDTLNEVDLDFKFKGKLKRIKSDEVNPPNLKINKNIFAVGYERNSLPKITFNSKQIPCTSLNYSQLAQLTLDSKPLDGLFGFGIAFPERVKDLDGADEAAVGLWKFMRHVKKSLEEILK